MGCGASSKTKIEEAATDAIDFSAFQAKAPNLVKYFQEKEALDKRTPPIKDLFKDGVSEKWKKDQADTKNRQKELVKQAFAAHDTQEKDNVLTVSESKVFFQNYIDVLVCYTKTAGPQNARALAVQSLIALRAMKVKEKQIEKMNLNEELEKAEKKILEDCEKLMADYTANKDKYDKAAFAVVDTNGDGGLVLEEIVEALTDETDSNLDLQVALGLMSPGTAKMKKDMKKAAAELEQALAELKAELEG